MKSWKNRHLEPGDPETPEWRSYRWKCREIARRNAGPGGYQGMPLPPGVKPTDMPIPRMFKAKVPQEVTQDELCEWLENEEGDYSTIDEFAEKLLAHFTLQRRHK